MLTQSRIQKARNDLVLFYLKIRVSESLKNCTHLYDRGYQMNDFKDFRKFLSYISRLPSVCQVMADLRYVFRNLSPQMN